MAPRGQSARHRDRCPESPLPGQPAPQSSCGHSIHPPPLSLARPCLLGMGKKLLMTRGHFLAGDSCRQFLLGAESPKTLKQPCFSSLPIHPLLKSTPEMPSQKAHRAPNPWRLLLGLSIPLEPKKQVRETPRVIATSPSGFLGVPEKIKIKIQNLHWR